LAVGEALAIGLLQDYSLTYNEDFDGFTVGSLYGDLIAVAVGDGGPWAVVISVKETEVCDIERIEAGVSCEDCDDCDFCEACAV
jgi:hypothetical protein